MDTLLTCPLRWLLDRHGGTDPVELPPIIGTVVHALAQAAASGADRAVLHAELDRRWADIDRAGLVGAPWFSRRESARLRSMLDTFTDWLAGTRARLRQLAVEQPLDVEIGEPNGVRLRLRGRVDRLETDDAGRIVVVDLKTGKNPVSADDAVAHPQLALYQLAVALGAFDDLLPGSKAGGPKAGQAKSGGARLVYLAKGNQKTGATERVQPTLTEDDIAAWREIVLAAASTSAGPSYPATENADCPTCPARHSCPVHDAGRQVPQ